ncbi:PhzF family phenazine biosynthesis protein [Spirosoma fluviale]|uniref:Trans-2,3-dihydro-3-hydroxyanthranilate isomerase n=1 Tax=Spirosoma fluviale TaxID=1597977 RepID=A0A286FBR7_9BACT|nr:PhzF family phenazine biosynthesis protein [Spirosoma fluviale]SOD80677.1 trans-2,3-dihydro-3-hydroxyanthranilate isomerase [Spirosoma fluviale]
MHEIKFYIVDVFAANRYEGNQLAVFLDMDNQLSDQLMQQIAKEINFAETTFIKAIKTDLRFVVRIFTPEHEVPFAGHPSLGTSYIINKFILPEASRALTLELAHSDIAITLENPANLDDSIFFMRQAQPTFGSFFTADEIANELGIPRHDIDDSLPIQEVSTGLPYIIIPLRSRAAIDALSLRLESFKAFLTARNKYRTNSSTGHSTSLFFFTSETYEADNDYTTRMLLIENNKVSEDAATGSANGCFLAYLLTHIDGKITATVEQGFQMNRKSYLYLNGRLANERYEINVGGRNKLISEGIWYA